MASLQSEKCVSCQVTVGVGVTVIDVSSTVCDRMDQAKRRDGNISVYCSNGMLLVDYFSSRQENKQLRADSFTRAGWRAPVIWSSTAWLDVAYSSTIRSTTPVDFVWRRPVQRASRVPACIGAAANRVRTGVWVHGSKAMSRKQHGSREVPRRRTICIGLESSVASTEQRWQAVMQKSTKSSRRSARC